MFYFWKLLYRLFYSNSEHSVEFLSFLNRTPAKLMVPTVNPENIKILNNRTETKK